LSGRNRDMAFRPETPPGQCPPSVKLHLLPLSAAVTLLNTVSEFPPENGESFRQNYCVFPNYCLSTQGTEAKEDQRGPLRARIPPGIFRTAGGGFFGVILTGLGWGGSALSLKMCGGYTHSNKNYREGVSPSTPPPLLVGGSALRLKNCGGGVPYPLQARAENDRRFRNFKCGELGRNEEPDGSSLLPSLMTCQIKKFQARLPGSIEKI